VALLWVALSKPTKSAEITKTKRRGISPPFAPNEYIGESENGKGRG
jgi:hypothetical protein